MKKKILLVDDEPDVIKAVTFRINHLDNYDIFVADSGEKALEIFEEECPHVVLLDVVLPDVDGFEVCRKLKKKNAETVVILYTGKIDAIDTRRAREAGADKFTVKTNDFQEIVNTLLKIAEYRPPQK